MAKLLTFGKHVVVVGFDKFIVNELRSDKVLTCHIPSTADIHANSTQQTNVGEKDGSNQILAAAFSSSGRYFAVSDDHKRLAVWDVASEWLLVNTRIVPRRATALSFTKTDEQILLADKSGDVHRFSISADGNPADLQGTIVVGHVSMLLDVKLCSSDKYVVTCDRDEKIRVSHYPNAYNIQSFCLGHSDFVSRLLYVEDYDLLLSGSGDGTVKLWNHVNGKLLDSFNCNERLVQCNDNITEDKETSVLAVHTDATTAAVRCLTGKGRLFAVTFEGRSSVLLFALTEESGTLRISLQYQLSLAAPVWDLAFVDSCHLVVLQSKEGAMAVPFYSETRTFSDMKSLADDADTDLGLLQITRRLNEDMDLFKSSQTASGLFPVLRKAHIDNLTEYIEKKKQLLTSRKGKQDTLSSFPKKQRIDNS